MRQLVCGTMFLLVRNLKNKLLFQFPVYELIMSFFLNDHHGKQANKKKRDEKEQKKKEWQEKIKNYQLMETLTEKGSLLIEGEY